MGASWDSLSPSRRGCGMASSYAGGRMQVAGSASAGRLRGDRCDRDWIWDREVETAPPAEVLRQAEAAWERQQSHLLEHSPFYARKLGRDRVKLAEIDRLPFTTKQELKQAIDERPPFGANAGAAPDRIKRVYQTS